MKQMTQFYKFDFEKGVPVEGAAMCWRKGLKTVAAYSLQGAVEKFALPTFREYGLRAKLNVLQAWRSLDRQIWIEIDTNSVIFAAFLTGCLERAKREQRKEGE